MKTRTVLTGSLLLVTASTLSAGAAFATVTYPGGGTWDQGLTSTVTYSNYYHGSLTHGSTAQSDYGTSRSPNITPGYWSNAQVKRSDHNNKTYWRTL